MKRVIVLLFTVFVNIAAFSQLNFENYEHDFGSIKEDGGNVSYTFKFTNTYSKPISIISVDVECGCTTPDWTKTAIPAGGTGVVKAEYEPFNRPGVFDKHLTVRSTEDTLELNIKGDVIPRLKSNVEIELPESIGNLLLKSTSLQIGTIPNNKIVEKDFSIYNNTDKEMKFTMTDVEIPAHIQLKLEPLVIAPKSFGKIIVKYDPMKKNDFGYMVDFISLKSNDEKEPVKQIAIRSTIEEFFPPMTEQELANAPKLDINNPIMELGSISGSNTISRNFTVTNTGKTPLIIRKLKSACDCVEAKIDAETIPAGKTATITLTFNPVGRSGTQSKSVYIYSNSPDNPVQIIRVKGKIQ